MRTETVELFTYNELSETAKEKACEWWRSLGETCHWSDEWRESIKEAGAFFGIETDWTVDPWSYAGGTAIMDNEAVANLEGIRAWKWFQNNYYDFVNASILSKECPFTGYCGDEAFLQPLRDFMKDPRHLPWVTVNGIFTDCVDSWARAFRGDIEYQASDEAIGETLEANEYEFTANGERWNG